MTSSWGCSSILLQVALAVSMSPPLLRLLESTSLASLSPCLQPLEASYVLCPLSLHLLDLTTDIFDLHGKGYNLALSDRNPILSSGAV
jgi:hypothetical protein